MSFKMFRYLEKNYIGKYRVLAHYDIETEDFPREDSGSIDEDFDDQYIPTARKGEIRASYRNIRGQDILCWYVPSAQIGKNVLKEIKDKYPDIWVEEDNCDSVDYFIYFNSNDIEKIADIVKPKTNGARIRPYSVKNLPKPNYVIPEKDNIMLNDIIKNMDKTEKMLFMKRIVKEFDTIIQQEKGSKYNISKERNESKLRGKMFIHYIGMWDKFIEFVKKGYKEYEKCR